MTRTLQMASRILSLAGQIDITDSAGALAYEAKAEFEWAGTHWKLFNGDVRLATLTRARWAWNPPWPNPSAPAAATAPWCWCTPTS